MGGVCGTLSITPLFHVYEFAPIPYNSNVSSSHTVLSVKLELIIGRGLKLTLMLIVESQP